MNRTGAISVLQLWGLWVREDGCAQRSNHADEAAERVCSSHISNPVLAAAIEQEAMHQMSNWVQGWWVGRQAPAKCLFEWRYVHQLNFGQIAQRRIEIAMAGLRRDRYPDAATDKLMRAAKAYQFWVDHKPGSAKLDALYVDMVAKQTEAARKMHDRVVAGLVIDFNREREGRRNEHKRAVGDPALFAAMLGNALRLARRLA